jgi:galactokinase
MIKLIGEIKKMDVNELVLVFKQYYDHSNVRVFFVESSSDVITEMTNSNQNRDYPWAQSFGIYIVTAKNKTDLIRLVSLNFEELGVIQISIKDLDDELRHDWTNYLKKTFSYLKEAGYCINCGMDLLIYGNIPNEVGLSSSKSIDALTAVILRTLYE